MKPDLQGRRKGRSPHSDQQDWLCLLPLGQNFDSETSGRCGASLEHK